MSTWVLREQLASKTRNRPIYLEQMVAIGPCCTDDLAKAARFASREDAMKSPAYVHLFSFFEPEPVSSTPREDG